ncbi:hypothetical protein ACFLTD_04920, partial [Elusimicrobiota bacterium]
MIDDNDLNLEPEDEEQSKEKPDIDELAKSFESGQEKQNIIPESDEEINIPELEGIDGEVPDISPAASDESLELNEQKDLDDDQVYDLDEEFGFNELDKMKVSDEIPQTENNDDLSLEVPSETEELQSANLPDINDIESSAGISDTEELQSADLPDINDIESSAGISDT